MKPFAGVEPAYVVVRIAVAILLGVHGYYRALAGGVAPFGAFLESKGFPAGTALAWAITVYEMTASILLAIGWRPRELAAGFAAILLCGIALVHGPEGWFVVGGGRNGVEYSALLLACLASIALAGGKSRG